MPVSTTDDRATLPGYDPDGCNCPDCRRARDHASASDQPESPAEYRCEECGWVWYNATDARECCQDAEPEGYTCSDCGEWYEYESSAAECCAPQGGDDDYPELDPLGTLYRLDVADLPARPARLCSIEQEIVDGGARAARLMYEIGLSQSSGLASYSADCRRGQVVVKEDGSLPDSGGEIVYSRFQLDGTTGDAQNLSEGLAKLRQLKELGLVESGESAGTHIHIAARALDGSTFQPQHMASLHELFCHLEDMLYALAACGWREHRLDSYGDGYCKVLPKIADSTPAKVVSHMRGDRYLGLNFIRLFDAVRECGCGACMVGDWNECDCGALDGATVEWRLFNSTTKPQTMHAWLLLAHALTAYAAQHTLGTLEPTPIRSGSPESRWAQLEWLLAEAPFTDDERDVIRDAAHRSPGFGTRSDTY